MRILMLGAGAIGGYFGGRMIAAGSDVTFLVRDRRAAQLKDGLKIESPRGNATIRVNTIVGGAQTDPFDVIVLCCKAYALSGALEAIAPHVRPHIPILPLLNGYAHLDQIQDRFPEALVWGGIAGIAATLTEDGTVVQMNPNQFITAGTRMDQPDSTAVLEALVSEMVRAEISATVTTSIEGSLWEKWTFLATLAAATCLMRGSIGQILATDHGEQLIAGLFDECNQTAVAEGHPPGPSPAQNYRGMLFEQGSPFTASMLRDIKADSPTEADHIIGDMIKRARRHSIATPLLDVAYSHLQVYEAQRAK
ncbi:unnamed protein product [Chondrus crispus]|uniref:2-dehydropantoate 2-reductase n=1 Tax=Chondrus crispus TaxID=2769 RepID=R7QAL7_CHOCR|nr:unnamed protein product [Chondrus crispus]CDF34485.1 unnamed protein product [Chondrus crispus]|eukprot:XP_005714304.1 unnamed protein product [Chondrus crispus]